MAGTPDLKTIATNILEDALQSIIQTTILHHQRQHRALIASLDASDKLPHCDTCRQPVQLTPPLAPKARGTTAQPPKDTVYCDRKPWSRRPGHDIYDNPFPKADATGRPPTKKEREAARQAKAAEGTPATDEPNGTGPPSPSENGEPERKLEKGEKKANKIDEKLRKGEYVPWHTCPSCKRSLLITRFAKHLEQCMGLSGRAASRNAMAKMGSTPSGSRQGTPGPKEDGNAGSGGRDGDEDDGEEDRVKGPASMKKKLLKKSLKDKVKKEKGLGGAAALNGKVPKGLAAAKNPPGSRASPAPGKRERDSSNEGGVNGGDLDDDEDSIHVKKRQKLNRVGSTASLASQSTAIDRTESVDGSFRDDASFADD